MIDKLKKYRYWILLGFAALLVVGFFPLRGLFLDYADQLLYRTLTQMVDKQTQGKYFIKYDQLRYNIFKQKIVLKNFVYFPSDTSNLNIDTNTTQNKLYFGVSIQQVDIDIENQFEFLFNDVLKIEEIGVESPQVQVLNQKVRSEEVELGKLAGNLYELVTQYLKVFELRNVRVRDAKMIYHLHTREYYKRFDFNSFSFHVNDFKLDQAEGMNADGRLMFTDDFELNSGYQEFVFPDSSHRVTFDRFNISLKKEFIELHNLRVERLEGNNEYGDKLDLFVPTIKFVDIDFNKAYNENKIEVEKLLVERPALNGKFYIGKRASERDSSLIVEIDSNKQNLIGAISDLLVDKLMLTGANFQVTLFDENNFERAFDIEGFTYKSVNLKVDSSTLADFKFEGLNEKFNIHIIKASHNLTKEGFQAELSNIDYSSITRTLDVDGISLAPLEGVRRPRNGQFDLLGLSVDQVHFSQFNIDHLIDKKNLDLSGIQFTKPNIKLSYDTSFASTPQIGSVAGVPMNTLLDTAFLKKFKVVDGRVSIVDRKYQNIEYGRFQDLNLLVEDIDINKLPDSSYVSDVLGRLALSTQNSFLKLPKKPDRINWKKFEYSAARKKLDIYGLRYLGNRETRNLDINVKLISADGLKPREMLEQNKFHLGRVRLSEGSIMVSQFSKGNSNTKLDQSFWPDLSIDSLAVQNVDWVRTYRDTIQEKVEHIDLNLGDLALYRDSLEKEKIQLGNLFVQGKKAHFSIDGNRHYIKSKRIYFSSSDSSLSFEKIELKPVISKKLHGKNPLMNSNIDFIKLSGLYYGENDIRERIGARSIEICSPEFGWTAHQKKGEKKSERSILELHEWFSNVTGIKQIAYKELNLENGKIYTLITDPDHPNKEWRTIIPQYSLVSVDFKLDSLQQNHDDRLFYSRANVLQAYQVKQVTPDSLRNLQIDYLKYNTLSKYLLLKGFEFNYMAYETDEKTPRLFVSGNLPQLELEGIKPLQVKDQKVVNLSKVHFRNPQVDVLQYHNESNTISRELEADQSGKDELALKKLLFDELKLEDGQINWRFTDTNKNAFNFRHVNLLGDEILVDEENNSSLPDFGELELSFGRFRLNEIDTFYDYKLDSINISTSRKNLTVFGSEFIPRFDINNFGRVAGWEKDRLEIYIPTFSISDFDIKKLIYEKKMRAGLVRADSLYVRTWKDKNYPMIDRFMPLPRQMLVDLPINVKVDSMRLDAGYVEHRQLSKNGIQNGTITFTDLSAQANNLTNDSISLKKNGVSNLTATTKLMGSGKIDAKFKFYLRDTSNRYSAEAHMGNFNATEINKFLEHTAYVKVRKGFVSSVDLSFVANDEYGVGDMRLLYENLGVDFLNKDPDNQKKMGILLKTFLANRVVHTKNPHFFITKKGHIFYRRDTTKALFHYWAHLAMSGVGSSMGVDRNKKDRKQLDKEIKKLKREELKREKAIRRREDEEEEQREAENTSGS